MCAMSTARPSGPVREPSAGRLTAAVAPSLLREMNQRLLLEKLFADGPATRPRLAKDAGLSQPTVIAALDGLERAGLVLARDGEPAQLGRPAKLYAANPGAGTVAGIDIGRGWLHLRVADLFGTTLAQVDVRNTATGAATLVELTARSLEQATEQAGLTLADVTHTAIGSPGVLDPRRGGVRYAANLPGWHQAGLTQALVERIGPSLSVDNDANLAALAELNEGAARGLTDFAYLTVGTGVGVGLVLDGRIYRGVTGAAGEVGYLPIGEPPSGRSRRSRRGMFEEVVAADAVVRYAKEAGLTGRLTAERVFSMARRGVPEALAAVAIQARQLAMAAASIAAFLDPQAIVMGGRIGQNLDLLEPPMTAALREVTPMRPVLVAGELGEEAVVRGAVVRGTALAREAVFAQRLLAAG
jgi:predicted NBD/HSP70 family sugar kinase